MDEILDRFDRSLPDHLPRQIRKPPRLPPEVGTIEISRYVTTTGLNLEPDVGYREWHSIGQTLMLLHEWTPWAIGDWLNFGERKWPERYTQAAEISGRSIKTLRNLAYIANAIPPEMRMKELSVGHHDSVASIKDPKLKRELLELGVKEQEKSAGNLTVPQFREMVREKREEAEVPYGPQGKNRAEVAFTEDCPHCAGTGKRLKLREG